MSLAALNPDLGFHWRAVGLITVELVFHAYLLIVAALLAESDFLSVGHFVTFRSLTQHTMAVNPVRSHWHQHPSRARDLCLPRCNFCDRGGMAFEIASNNPSTRLLVRARANAAAPGHTARTPSVVRAQHSPGSDPDVRQRRYAASCRGQGPSSSLFHTWYRPLKRAFTPGTSFTATGSKQAPIHAKVFERDLAPGAGATTTMLVGLVQVCVQPGRRSRSEMTGAIAPSVIAGADVVAAARPPA
jgi:hypothetical protein